MSAMKKTKNALTVGTSEWTPSQLIDARIKEMSDWRGEMLARVRMLIKQADPDVAEEGKWRGVPVWSHAGIICTGETYKSYREVDLRQGRGVGGPVRPLQLRPRGQLAACHRFSRGRED